MSYIDNSKGGNYYQIKHNNIITQSTERRTDTVKLMITFYVSKKSCSGYIKLHDEERLSDYLNSRFRPEDTDGFLQISDASMTLQDNTKERLPEATINRSAIQLVAIQDSDVARGLGGRTGLRSYPYVEKNPVLVRLHLQEFSIIGNMHCAAGQTAYNLLEENMAFIPLTQVKMLTPDMSTWWKAPFAAVNREKITILSEATTEALY